MPDKTPIPPDRLVAALTADEPPLPPPGVVVVAESRFGPVLAAVRDGVLVPLVDDHGRYMFVANVNPIPTPWKVEW